MLLVPGHSTATIAGSAYCDINFATSFLQHRTL
jgi:hypothetical protein